MTMSVSSILSFIGVELKNFISVPKLTWHILALVFIAVFIVCAGLGLFIPFIAARSFGIGAGLAADFAVWVFYYIVIRNSGN